MHEVTAHELNRRLGKGINLGNALDTNRAGRGRRPARPGGSGYCRKRLQLPVG
jgi:hypothetical protein